MKKRVVCENLRSAYNVGNIIRTADGLGRGVILLGYTAPKEHKKVAKTALGAEQMIDLLQFFGLDEFYEWVQNNQICVISAEHTNTSVALDQVKTLKIKTLKTGSIASGIIVVMGNEVTGVEQTTLDISDYILHIPMFGDKESFNVGQAAAIFMREINQMLK